MVIINLDFDLGRDVFESATVDSNILLFGKLTKTSEK